MSLHFHLIKIKEVKKETNDCVSISLYIPEELKSLFQYKHGQDITVRAFINNEEVRRTYSLCSSPLENDFRIAIKKAEQGIFSTYANEQLKANDVLEIMPPIGKFNTELNSTHKKTYLAFAAGSGITPVISIIKTTLQTEPESDFILVYGNKNHNSIIFKEELFGLKNKYINRFQLVHILSKEKTDATINHGRINEEKLIELNKIIRLNSVDEFFICGSEEMIFCVRDFLLKENIEKKKIHFELFGTKNSPQSIVNSPQLKNNSSKSNITIKLDGRSFDFDLAFNDESILDAALQQGADLPYACKGGVCTTCKAKLLEGRVTMDVNYGLEPEEVEQGFILTCQSHPTTNKVVVDYDIK